MRKQRRVSQGERYEERSLSIGTWRHESKVGSFPKKPELLPTTHQVLLRMSKSIAQLLVLLLLVACATTANAATPAPASSSSSSASSDTPVPSTCDQDESGQPSVQAFATQADSENTQQNQSLAVVLGSVGAVAAAAGIIVAVVVSRRRAREPSMPTRAPKLSPPVAPACELEEIVLTNSTMARSVTPPMSPFSTKMYVYTAQI